MWQPMREVNGIIAPASYLKSAISEVVGGPVVYVTREIPVANFATGPTGA